MVDRSFYCSILSQIFSPCGNYLVVGNIYGELAIFDLPKVLNPDDSLTSLKQKPFYKFPIEEYHQVNSLASSKKFLIVGTKGNIYGYEWEHLPTSKPPVVSWNLTPPAIADKLGAAEINVLLLDNNDKLYAGSGDNKIHVFSLEDGRLLRSLEGHKNYIHDMSFKNGNELISCSEDGSVCLWDLRTNVVSIKLEPFKHPKVARPELGKWIGAVDTDKDWLVCGGGPKASVWHLGSQEVTSVFDSGKKGIHVNKFHEERVLIGSVNSLDQFTLQGDEICSIPCSSLSVYSLVLQEQPHHLMCIAGSSSNIDLCTNFNFRDQILSVRD